MQDRVRMLNSSCKKTQHTESQRQKEKRKKTKKKNQWKCRTVTETAKSMLQTVLHYKKWAIKVKRQTVRSRVSRADTHKHESKRLEFILDVSPPLSSLSRRESCGGWEESGEAHGYDSSWLTLFMLELWLSGPRGRCWNENREPGGTTTRPHIRTKPRCNSEHFLHVQTLQARDTKVYKLYLYPAYSHSTNYANQGLWHWHSGR